MIRIRANTIVRLGVFKDRADRFCKNLRVGESLVFSTACVLLGVRGYVSATRPEDGELLIVFASPFECLGGVRPQVGDRMLVQSFSYCWV